MRTRLPLFLLILLLSLPLATAAAAPGRVLLLGDSLSAAHNIPVAGSWPQLLAKRLAEREPPLELVNASISGETTAAGLARLPGLLQRHAPQLLILELGANDGLRGLPLQQIRDNLAAMMDLASDAGARVLLLGIELPVNYGPQYRDGLRAIYQQLAQDKDTALLPFLLQDVALDATLMQADGLHPTAAAQPRLLHNVWQVLAPLLDEWQATDDG
ncbi:MAG: arylesterase [Ottowia sp.]|nr:arylesterase [Ottowia sp.]